MLLIAGHTANPMTSASTTTPKVTAATRDSFLSFVSVLMLCLTFSCRFSQTSKHVRIRYTRELAAAPRRFYHSEIVQT